MAPPSELCAMIDTVALSGSPVKSQQLGEPDLTLEQRRQLLWELYQAKPLVFLERYQVHLRPEHLSAFAHLGGDCRAQHYSREVLRRSSCPAAKTRPRNQRYAALRVLQQEGRYFSEEQMRLREPLLYEQYIGQYLSEEELPKRSEGLLQGGAVGLTDLLLDTYQERLLQSRPQEQRDNEDAAQEESEEDDDGESRGRPPAQALPYLTVTLDLCPQRLVAPPEPSAEEKALLRDEFVSQMYRRFLDGKDRDFNYSQLLEGCEPATRCYLTWSVCVSEVDEHPDYDNLDIVSRDAEERYFDEEEEEEVEETVDEIP